MKNQEDSLAQAAQALVRAATKEVRDDTLANNATTVTEVKHIRATVDQIKRIDDTGLETNTALLTEVKRLRASIDQLKKQQEGLLKLQRTANLQWAMANASIGAFEYHDDPNKYESVSSSTLVSGILGTFLQSKGRFLPDGRLKAASRRYNAFTAEEVTDFHKAIADHIFRLTGSEPSLRLTEGKMAIFASIE